MGKKNIKKGFPDIFVSYLFARYVTTLLQITYFFIRVLPYRIFKNRIC